MPPNVLDELYLQALIDVARARASTMNPNEIQFDTSGSILFDITKAEIQKKFQEKFGSSPECLEFLKTKSDTTTISLDITADPRLTQLNQSFINQVIIDLTCDIGTGKKQELNILPKGSINPIYRELYFNLTATKRIYQKIKHNNANNSLDAHFTKAFDTTLKQVNLLVMQDYRKIISSIHSLNEGSITAINQRLDDSRKSILSKAHELFLYNLQQQKINFNKAEIKGVGELAEDVTATPNDIVYVGSQQVMWAAGNDVSSHHRKLGDTDNICHQRSITCAFLKEKVIANKNSRVHVRVPSIAVKRPLDWLYYFKGRDAIAATDKTYIDDVAVRLNKLCIKEDFRSKYDNLYDEIDRRPHAFIYNLYTAIDDLGDTFLNQQSQSAEYILKGAHKYNSERYKEAEKIAKKFTGEHIVTNGIVVGNYWYEAQKDARREKMYCLVQNISVNGYGRALGSSGSALVKEATLMTDMALMQTLEKYDSGSSVTKAFKAYDEFLKTDNLNFFSQSKNVTDVLKNIDKFKTDIKNRTEKSPAFSHDAVTTTTLAQDTLAILMAYDRHHRNDAALFQSLSVFVEPISIGGCKSSLDRTPMIAARVAMLDRALNTPLADQPDAIKKINEALKNFVDNYDAKKVTVLEQELDLALMNAVNIYGLQTGPAMQTNADIGGAPKYNAKFIFTFMKTIAELIYGIIGNRNNAENPKMNNVAQKNATQIHVVMKPTPVWQFWKSKDVIRQAYDAVTTNGTELSCVAEVNKLSESIKLAEVKKLSESITLTDVKRMESFNRVKSSSALAGAITSKPKASPPKDNEVNNASGSSL